MIHESFLQFLITFYIFLFFSQFHLYILLADVLSISASSNCFFLFHFYFKLNSYSKILISAFEKCFLSYCMAICWISQFIRPSMTCVMVGSDLIRNFSWWIKLLISVEETWEKSINNILPTSAVSLFYDTKFNFSMCYG